MADLAEARTPLGIKKTKHLIERRGHYARGSLQERRKSNLASLRVPCLGLTKVTVWVHAGLGESGKQVCLQTGALVQSIYVKD